MGRIKAAPYYLRGDRGRAVLDFSTPEGRKRIYLGVPFDPERSNPKERRIAQEEAEKKWRELTSERVLEEDSRVKTQLTFFELYALYLDKWHSEDIADINLKRRLNASFIVRKTYGVSIKEWASDEAVRSDGSKRWHGDKRTPLQRIVADEGPSDFLGYRLTKVVRKTAKKEKSNLSQFLQWAKANGYLASIPEIKLPAGKGVKALKNGRGVHLPLTPLDARKIIAAMPEWSRGKKDPFLVRSFFEFMWLTGLRPVTIERLEVGRNWSPGDGVLRLTEDDDKAAYGRHFPLTKMAGEILERISPPSGHIWGYHDRRKYVKQAAAIVFKEDFHRQKLFGSYHLRHFVGTFLANRAGTNLPAAQFVLGHVDLTTTSQYVHPDQEAARALLEGTEAELRRAAKEADEWFSQNSVRKTT